jgi:DNA-binding response OmpR family regulator
MQIVVASSSAHRQALYRDAIAGLGHEVSTANGGVECVERLRKSPAALLLLEAPLLWGGSDGVLDVVQHELDTSPPVIVVAVGSGSIDWFQLSRFRVDDFLFRVPTTHELERAIGTLLASSDRFSSTNKRPGVAGRPPDPSKWQAVGARSETDGHAWFANGSNISRGADSR